MGSTTDSPGYVEFCRRCGERMHIGHFCRLAIYPTYFQYLPGPSPDKPITCSTGYCQCEAKSARIAALEAQLAEETARLDWYEVALRRGDISVVLYPEGFEIHDDGVVIADREPSLRAAIDAARKRA